MIVDADGSFRSQRTDPVLAVVRCSVENGSLTLRHESAGSVTAVVDRDSAGREVTMFGTPLRGIDQGDDIAAWLTDVIGEPSRLDAPLPIDRFRPNIVVDGSQDAHVEDEVRDISIGDARLTYTKLAIRCAVTTVEQSTGVRTGPEPLRTLGTYRRARQKGVAFGSKFSVIEEGTISVGDELRVETWGESEL